MYFGLICVPAIVDVFVFSQFMFSMFFPPQNTRTGELTQLEKSYRFLHSENEFFRTVVGEIRI